MKTEIIKIDPHQIDADKIRQAAGVIQSGGLVAFPTETVYGLGANALNSKAVEGIFKAKGRPSDNPLIVHIADKNDLFKLTCEVSPCADDLMHLFWPGPLTMVFKKSEAVPSIITAGLDTVAVRMPSHPVALALIQKAGLPIAAPSANSSGKPSPTLAKHVIEDLWGKVDIIIDAGSADVGLESTVLDTTTSPPLILRPGGITAEQLRQALGNVKIDPGVSSMGEKDIKPRSPGMKYTHYSPKADVLVIQGEPSSVVRKILQLIPEYAGQGLRIGVLATEETMDNYSGAKVISCGSRSNPGTIASNLFRVLREFDEENTDIVLAEAVDSEGIGLAIMNRLNKAAGYNIIKA